VWIHTKENTKNFINKPENVFILKVSDELTMLIVQHTVHTQEQTSEFTFFYKLPSIKKTLIFEFND